MNHQTVRSDGRRSRLISRLVSLALVVGLLPLAAMTPAQAAGDKTVVNSWAPAGAQNVATTSTVTAHSSQPSWPPSYLIDLNPGIASFSLWVANDLGNHGWVNFELAQDEEISRVVVFPRGDGVYYGQYFPNKYTVTLLDSDGTEVWSTARSHTTRPTNPDEIDVPMVTARTVRIDVQERSEPNAAGGLQLSEVAIFNASPILKYQPEGAKHLVRDAVITAESSLEDAGAGWGLQFLKDELIDTAKGWTSNSLPKVTDPSQQTWVQYDLGADAWINRLAVFPHVKNFPQDYRLQISRDKVTWHDVATSTGNPDAVAQPQVFDLPQRTSGRYVRLMVDRRNTANSDDTYGYQVQLAELAAFGQFWALDDYAPEGTTNLAPSAALSYSSSYERAGFWGVGFANNGDAGRLSPGWSTNILDQVTDPATSAWFAYDFGCPATVDRLVVFPQEKYFPKDYRIQVSDDGATWSTVATSTGNDGAQTVAQSFDLQGTSARHVRLHVDVRNGPADADGYLARVSEFAVFGSQSCLGLRKPALLMEPGNADALWLLNKGVAETPAFRSEDESVATVSAAGQITAVAAGRTKVVATAGAGSASIEVEVRNKIKRIGEDMLVTGFWMMDPEHVNSEQFATVADFGLDLLMSNENVANLGLQSHYKVATLAEENGFSYQPADTRMGWTCGNIPGMTSEQIKEVLDDYLHVPGVNSIYICDEQMPATAFAPAFNTTVEHAPGLYPHYNFLPHVDATTKAGWLEATGGIRRDWNAPDYLMFDYYPLWNTIDYAGWFNNLNTTRQVGLQYQVKTGTYLQSVGYGSVGVGRRPTAPEVVWEANTALAYGYKQLAYFTYWQPVNRGENFTAAIMKADGTKTDWFDDLKQLNSEVHALGPTLMKLDAQNVFFNGATHGQATAPVTLAAPKADGTLAPATFFAKVDGSQNLLLSHLVDRETKDHYLFVVNNTFSGTNPAATTATLTFDPSVRGLQEVSRVDGSTSDVLLDNGSLPLELAGAEGRLYRLAIPDLDALEGVIAGAQALDAGSYTSSSWVAADLAAAIEQAQQVLADPMASASQIQAAKESLETAIAQLVPLGDPAVLEVLLDAAQGLSGKLDGFTKDSVAALTDAVAAAEVAYQNRGDRSQAQIDEAVATLHQALNGLEAEVPQVDRSVLRSVHDGAAGLSNNGGYTAASWAQLQVAIGVARGVLEEPAATQAQVDAAVVRLNSALVGLELAASEPVVTMVKLNQRQLRLVKGTSLKLEGAVYFQDQHAPYSGKVTWSSSNAKVATVSSSGKVKAKKPGTAVITVTSKGTNAAGLRVSATIKVTVVKSKSKAKVKKVTAAVPRTMRVGQVVYLTGTYSPAKATGVKVTYSTTKPGVTMVDKAGRLVAQSKGTEYVKVKAGNRTITYKVTVR